MEKTPTPSEKTTGGSRPELDRKEPLPDGLQNLDFDPEAPPPDLYTLLSGLASLRNEVALQGRGLHELTRQFSQFLDEHAAQGERVELKEVRVAATEEAKKLLVDPLLDTHELIESWKASLQNRVEKAGFWRRLFSRNARQDEDATLRQASILERKVVQLLETVGIEPLAQDGVTFDPQRMQAIDSVQGTGQPAGTVVEVYRQGYSDPQRVWRFAEVKVALGNETNSKSKPR